MPPTKLDFLEASQGATWGLVFWGGLPGRNCRGESPGRSFLGGSMGEVQVLIEWVSWRRRGSPRGWPAGSISCVGAGGILPGVALHRWTSWEAIPRDEFYGWGAGRNFSAGLQSSE